MAPGHHNQDTHTGRRNDGGRGNPTPLRTQGLSSNPRFSYMESPVEAQPGVFNQFSSPTNSSIDESPITPYTPQSQPMPHITEDARHSPYPEEKRAPNQVDVTYEAPVFLDVHSATFSPYAQASPREVYTPSATYPLSTLSPHQQSIAPVPRVVMRDAASSSVPETRYADIDRKQEFVRPSTTSRTPTYNPNALAGPNVALEYHRPGQMSHPNAAVQPQWKHGLCEADTLCCTGLFCPCILYGKTQYRLSQKSKRREATDLLGYKSFNGACGLMAVACGFQWVLASIQHTRIRKQYHLTGSFGDDCVKSLCCCCCVLMQNEREVRTREELLRRHAGPATGAYVSPATMTYAPPPR